MTDTTTEMTIDLTDALDQCQWRAKKIRDNEQAIARLQADYTAQIGEIQVWFDAAKVQHERERDRLTLEMRPYVTALTEADPLKRKSVELVAGRAGFRAGQPRLVVDDTDECMSWLAENDPDLIRVKRELDLAAIKARMADGERFPGVRLEAGETSYYVKTLAKKP